MALRGLSSPVTSRAGNLYGIVGMVIAIGVTVAHAGRRRALADPRRHRHRRRDRHASSPAHPDDGAAAAGGGLPLAGRPRRGVRRGGGVRLARGLRHRHRPATSRRHSLIEMGLGTVDRRHHLHRLDRGLRQAAGPGHRARRWSSAASIRSTPLLGIAIVVLLVWFAMRGHPITFIAADRAVAGARLPADPADRRRRHAGRGLDAELLFGLGGGRHRLHPGQHRADRHRRAGRLLGRDPELHHVQGHEPLDLQRDPGRLRHRQLGGGRGARQDRQAGQGGLGRGRGLHDEERRVGDHRAGLRHGGGAGPARAARDGRHPEEGGRGGAATPSIRWPAACRAT